MSALEWGLSPPLLALIAVLLVLVLGLALALLWARWRLRRASMRWSRASRARNAAAQRGEAEAEALLEDEGYEIVGEQVAVEGTMYVDGEPRVFRVRLDLIARRGGHDYIVEVKTGDLAPDPTYPPTRRQLREYASLLPDYGLLLVDVDRGEVVTVEFDDELASS